MSLLHTSLGRRHRQILDSLARKKEYGTYRKVLEKSLEELQDITKRKRLERSHEDRVKELDCFYGISKLVEHHGSDIAGIFEGVVALLPTAWQYPHITCARITYDEQTFQTPNFKETMWKQTADIKTQSKKIGAIEAYYLEEKPELYEGPFLKGERDLIDAVAERLGRIIERIDTEKQLHESEERFRILAENAADMIYRYSVDKGFEYVNPSSTAIMGYTPEEHYADPELGLKIVHPEDRPKLLKVIEDFREHRQPQQPVEIRWLHKNGYIVVTEQRNVPIYDETGKLVAMQGIARDITQRKQLEETLRETQELLTSLLDYAPMPIHVVSIDNRYCLVNRSWENFMGLKREEVIGRSIDQVFSAEVSRQLTDVNQRVINSGTHVVAQEFIDLQDGRHYYHTVKFPVRDTKGRLKAVGGISVEITGRKSAMNRLQASNQPSVTGAESDTHPSRR